MWCGVVSCGVMLCGVVWCVVLWLCDPGNREARLGQMISVCRIALLQDFNSEHLHKI